jgi:ELWxxDGT repeat protein
MLEFSNNIPVFVQDIYPGPKQSSPYELTRFRNNAIVFSALSPEYGEELWYSSGDPNDTRILEDLYPGEESSFPYHQVLFKGHVFFAATDPLNGRELRRFTAFDLGIELVANIHKDRIKTPSSSPHEITPVGNKLFFVADDVVHGSELWVSDGTAEGTHLVKDIFPGRTSSNPAELTSIEVQKGEVYFRADNGTHGVELWVSDGTEEGTKMLHDISIQGDGAPRNFTSLGYKILFVAHSDDLGSELWVFDGHAVHQLMDIRPGKESSNPKDLKMWNGKVYFRADDGMHGEELWVTDGVRKNTYMLKDLVELPVELSFSRELVPFKNSMYFAFNDGVVGDELWSTSADGKDMGLFMDIARK